MATIVDDGWLVLTDGSNTLKLAFQRLVARRVFAGAKIKHYDGGGHYGYDFGKRYWTFNISGIYFKNHTDYDNTVKYLEDWQDAGTFTLSVYRNSSSNLMTFDSDSTITVMIPQGGFQVEKIAPYNGTVYVMEKLQLEQAG